MFLPFDLCNPDLAQSFRQLFLYEPEHFRVVDGTPSARASILACQTERLCFRHMPVGKIKPPGCRQSG